MASAIEDVRRLPGESVSDQDGRKIGEIKKVYGIGEEDSPMWVTVETPTGTARSRIVFIPLARLKEEDGEIRVPYSKRHVQSVPEVEASDELSEHDDRVLRHYYAIDLGDQEVRSDNESYAAQVPEEEGAPRPVAGED